MRLLLLPLLLLTAAVANSQPALTTSSLTSATNLPAAGTYFHRNNAALAGSPGNAGPNVIWDFSGLTAGSSVPYDYRLCSAITNCNNFPGTNLVLLESHPSYNLMSYFICDSFRLSLKGLASSTPGGYAAVYTDPEDLLRFPFRFLDSYTDTFACVSSPPYGNQTGTVKVTADGYGTLILPQGSFYNVLRIRRDERSVSAAGTYQSTTYSWYDTALNEYLLMHRAAVLNGITQLPVMSFTDQMPLKVSAISGLDASLQLSPNPARGAVHVRFYVPEKIQLKISMTDQLGRPVRDMGVRNFSQGQQDIDLQTDGIATGIYFVRLQTDGRTATRRVFIE